MKKYSDLEYLKLNKWQRFVYKLLCFFYGIPQWFVRTGKAIGRFFVKFGKGIKNEAVDIWTTFKNGDWKTKVSYLVMGFGSICRGQILRGVIFLLFEVLFIVYMIFKGAYWISMLPSLGKVGPEEVYNEILDTYTTKVNDNSFKIMLYGILTLFLIIAFIFTWRINVKQNKISEEILKAGKKLKSGKEDLHSLVDDQFHKTLLALPVVGIMVFTVMPIIFMILVAFTNYDGSHDGANNALFKWVGWSNFATLFNFGTGGVGSTFGEVLLWTLIWAFFATFTNYFLGMVVAMIINKKGIKFKKFWRTVLVLTIAIPQFISLLYISKMFATTGIVNKVLADWFGKAPIDFWGDAQHYWRARILVILLNIWIGIPYLMLMTTGVLMNIPADLYESARIDGANTWQQYKSITLPYILFVTGPYLLTSFIGNMNNFNVIYLLTGGRPNNATATSQSATSVGYTDLLVTWLYNIAMGNDTKYYLASVIGIMVFVVVAVLSMIVYNAMPSIKNEEDFS